MRIKKRKQRLLSKTIRLGIDGLIIVFISLALLEIILRTASWYQFHRHPAFNSTPKAGEIRILCIGESTTAMGGAAAYPSVLQNLLDTRFGKGRFRVINEGIIGADTLTLLQRLPSFMEKHRPQITIFMVGINDRWSLSAEGISRLQLSSLRSLRLFQLLYLNIRYAMSKRKGEINSFEEKVSESLQRETLPVAKMLSLVSQEKYQGAEELLVQIKPSAEKEFKIYQSMYFALRREDRKELVWIKEHFVRFAEREKVDPRPFKFAANAAYKLQDRTETVKYSYKAFRLGERDSLICQSIAHDLIEKKDFIEAAKVFEAGFSDAVESSKFDYIVEALLFLEKHNESKKMAAVTELFYKRYPKQLLFSSNGKTFAKFLPLSLPQFRQDSFHPYTTLNLRKMVDIAKKNGSLAVVMQYPTLSADPLRRLFEDEPEVLVLENSANFIPYLDSPESYDKVFIDHFGTGFGHTNSNGSRLIAENILNSVPNLAALAAAKERQFHEQ